MKGMSRIRTVLLLALCCGALSSHAQDVIRSTDTFAAPKPPKSQSKPIQRIKPKGPKAVRSEASVGFRLNTNGWSAYTDLGKVRAKDSKRADMFNDVALLQLEVSEKKSPRQQKINGDGSSGSGSSSYVYGKINNFYGIKLGIGYRKLLAGKPDQGSVSIHWVNVLGGSLGLLKPYYINISGDPTAIKYSQDNRDKFLNQSAIMGGAGFSQGLSEMTFVPGGHIKSALHFDFSANRRIVSAVEVGFNAEFYAQQIKLMANEDGTNYFFDVFLGIQFGKRW
jgi:hypothetical protein